MKKLDSNWLTEGVIDFEYKKYLLLAYLQRVQKQFEQVKLYPSFEDLLKHYENLISVKSGKEGLSKDFPGQIVGLDPKSLSLKKKKLITDDDIMIYLSQMVEFALPQVKDKLQSAKDIYEFVESQLDIEHVGIQPLYNREGYLLIYHTDDSDVFVYKYESSLIETANEKYRALKTDFLFREKRTITKTFESIKLNLTKTFKNLPNPSTWLVTSSLSFPLVETFLPVTKRLLMHKLHTSE